MTTIRELTAKCSVHNTPLTSRAVGQPDGLMGAKWKKQPVGRLYWCPICDQAAKPINYSR